jgi:hypothetical protein
MAMLLQGNESTGNRPVGDRRSQRPDDTTRWQGRAGPGASAIIIMLSAEVRIGCWAGTRGSRAAPLRIGSGPGRGSDDIKSTRRQIPHTALV